MENETFITGKGSFGIPPDLIFKMGSRWVPIGNVKFNKSAKNRRRHHFQTCPECGQKKKNIRRHYKLYHKEFFYRFFIKPLTKSTIGQLYGVRFIETK